MLSGKINGKAGLATFIGLIDEEPAEPTILFLDFAQIEFASGSYLRESTFNFKKFVRSSYSNFYPVVANITDEIAEELRMVAELSGDVVMSCVLDRKGHPSNPVLLGSLDPKQDMTFGLVETLGSCDANGLMKTHGAQESTKSTTAWNNRLSGLAARGVVREFTSGRSKHYRPLFAGDNHGG